MYYFIFNFCDSETISTEVFYLVQRQMEQYYEVILSDKKKIPIWSHRLHLALKAYQVGEIKNTIIGIEFEERSWRKIYSATSRNFFILWWQWTRVWITVLENLAKSLKATSFTFLNIAKRCFPSFCASTRLRCHGESTECDHRIVLSLYKKLIVQ